jgi:DNA-binding response OmpR family regulator
MNLSSLKEVRDIAAAENNVLFTSSQPRVLIVDGDHPSVLAVYSMAKSFNSQIDAANGVEAALNCLKKSRYDAVITNLEMDGLSGYDLAGWIRDKSPDTGVIIMTDRDRTEIERYVETGVVDRWIFKPFGEEELRMALDEFVPRDSGDPSGSD